eukprot:gnl/Ergobibamus_cyprinoides/5661.p1 GENE.gnl/Ergobibamus_cyprinoides/5661~~gnl/Ergobibamus_cyprinoides/5661.p1  ORF type:complete len:117 (-),score=29.23 gnl/Ergobibamus_cyprinoides/5661:450-800(-)
MASLEDEDGATGDETVDGDAGSDSGSDSEFEVRDADATGADSAQAEQSVAEQSAVEAHFIAQLRAREAAEAARAARIAESESARARTDLETPHLGRCRGTLFCPSQHACAPQRRLL